MKNGMMVAGLAVLLAGTAFGQGGSGSNGAAASGTMVTNDREKLESPKPTNFWDGDDPNLVNLVTHPFANKKYVQRQVAPIRDRISELDEITAENASKIKDIDARAQKGIQLASDKASLADQHSTDAMNKAQLAQTSATEASNRVGADERLVGNLDQYQGTAQTEIRFRPGQSVLSKDAKDALDNMASPLKGQKSYIIEVRGFSAGRGQAAIANSEKMADSVVRYLVETHAIPIYRIFVLSMGDAATSDGTTKRVTGGRVEVNVMKNDLTAQR